MTQSNEEQQLLSGNKSDYSYSRQMMVILSISFGNFLVGCGSGFPGPAGHELQSPKNTDIYGNPLTLTLQQVSWMTSVYPLGTLIGSCSGGYIMNAIGRKTHSAFFIATMFFASNLVISLAPSLNVLIAGRILGGIGCGLQVSTVSLYMLETTKPEFRSGVLSYMIIFQIGGIIFIFSLSIILEWPYLALVTALCSVLFGVLVELFAVESPVWAFKAGKTEECEKAIKWLCGDEKVNTEVIINEVIRPMIKDPNTSTWSQVNANRKLIIISAIFSLSFFLIGLKQILSYLNTILALLNVESRYSGVIIVVLSVAELIGSLISLALAKKFNRRPILIHSVLATGVALGLLTAMSYLISDGVTPPSPAIKWLVAVTLTFYFLFPSMGIISLCWPVSVEILPPEIRSSVTSYIFAFGNIVSFISLKTFANLLDSFQLDGTLLFCTVLCFCNGLFIIIFVPETKNKI